MCPVVCEEFPFLRASLTAAVCMDTFGLCSVSASGRKIDRCAVFLSAVAVFVGRCPWPSQSNFRIVWQFAQLALRRIFHGLVKRNFYFKRGISGRFSRFDRLTSKEVGTM